MQIDLLQSVPAPEATMVQPRAMGAYGALVAAATLGVLYLYRGRAFIVYWIGAWLMLAAGLLITTQPAADPRLGGVLLGLALLLIVFAAGLLFLAAESFPTSPLRWNLPIRAAAGSAVWFLAAPFVLSLGVLVSSGVVAAGGLLALGAWRYLQLARSRRYAGAALIGAGLVALVLSNVLGAAADGGTLNRLAVVNLVTGVFLSLGMHLLVFEDMTAELRQANQHLAAANEEVKRLAITDPLTGCHNRRFFDEIERREMQRHRRYGTPLSVVFVDVDRFKQLNDSLGHDAGDAVLRALGAVLRRHVRESDYVIRWGGDEFLLLLACGIREAAAKARELKAAFVRERAAQALPDTLALSIGVSTVGPSVDTLADAIREADAAMYRDKLNTTGS